MGKKAFPRHSSRIAAVEYRLLSAALSLGVLLVLFALTEITMRVAGIGRAPGPAGASADSPSMVCEPDSLLGWLLPASTHGVPWCGVPGVVETTNAWGLRSPPIQDGPPDLTRILVIGDSYAFGWGVRESDAFPRKLESLLRARRPGARIEVVNAAVPGYALYQQRIMLDRLAARFHFDLVISTFSLSNDMIDEVRIRRYAPGDLAEYSPAIRASGSRTARLIAASRLLTWIDSRTMNLQFKLGNARSGAIRLAEESLEGVIQTCHRRQIPLLLVIVPRRAEVVGKGWGGALARWSTRGARAMVAGVAARHEVPTVDITGVLSRMHETGSAYLTGDPHWTPAAHAAIADTLVEAVERAAFPGS
jgi:hypothetical protein